MPNLTKGAKQLKAAEIWKTRQVTLERKKLGKKEK